MICTTIYRASGEIEQNRVARRPSKAALAALVGGPVTVIRTGAQTVAYRAVGAGLPYNPTFHRDVKPWAIYGDAVVIERAAA
jgi:hypothetical protein